MSYNPITITNYFIKKYGDKGNLTPLKLIKLCYIAYGWYLALTNGKEKLINDRIEAWELGPVFPNLYHTLKRYKKSAIKEPVPIVSHDIINDEDSKFLDKIWDVYGKYDGVYLGALTHSENTPWSLTYPKGFNVEIPDELIFQHYKEKITPTMENMRECV